MFKLNKIYTYKKLLNKHNEIYYVRNDSFEL